MAKWIFPADVKGWLSEAEGRALATLAEGKVVVEIGSFHGRSTICMAQTATRVFSIDTHAGGGQNEIYGKAGESLAALRANLERFGVAEKVSVFIRKAGDVFISDPVDLFFIDGAHDLASIREDIALARRWLKPDGFVAFHDFDMNTDPEVVAAIKEIIDTGSEIVQVIDRTAIVRLGQKKAGPGRFFFLAYPRRPGFQPEGEIPGGLSAVRPIRNSDEGGTSAFKASKGHSSLINVNFNRLWVRALNLRKHGFTHFGMQHDDIEPCVAWADILADEMQRTNADMVSAVVPIKDDRGLTTTGIRNTASGQIRRLTMKEIFDLPVTFSLADAQRAGIKSDPDADPRQECLVVNSGLWLSKFNQGWNEPAPAALFVESARLEKRMEAETDAAEFMRLWKRHRDTQRTIAGYFPGFQCKDGIRLRDDGQAEAMALSEDWMFSEWAWRNGLTVYATRATRLVHWNDEIVEEVDGDGKRVLTMKPMAYPNDSVWGKHGIDPGDTPKV